MRGRHRLTVHHDLLPQAPGDPRLRIGKRNLFGANTAVSTPDPSLRIHQRDRMRRPPHIVPRAIARRSHVTRAATTPAASVPPHTPPFDPDRQPPVNPVPSTLARHLPNPRQ